MQDKTMKFKFWDWMRLILEGLLYIIILENKHHIGVWFPLPECVLTVSYDERIPNI